MGTFIGHVAPGFGFLFIGLWHLFNNIKRHSLHPNSYITSPWFPAKNLKHLELFMIMVGSSLSVAMELFIGPDRHQPLDPDWTIPSNHLHNFEHASISLSFFIYAAFALLFDYAKHTRPPAHEGLTHLLAAIAFGQQLLIFHQHSADHMGVEGQYHLLLQIVILVSMVTTLMGIGLPRSFLISFVRSLSIFFQGVWFIVMGIMLWTPSFIPKGCYLNLEEGHKVVRCDSDHSLSRAKSLVNLQFSWFMAGVAIFAVFFYIILFNKYAEKVEYRSVEKEERDEDDGDDLEQQRKLEETQSFAHMGKGLAPIDLER